MGRAVAGLTAHAKGDRLGLFEPTPEAVKAERERMRRQPGALEIRLLGRAVTVVHTKDGLRALDKGAASNPASVEKYIAGKFRHTLDEATEAMRRVARSRPPEELAAHAFHLYEQFRPTVPEGEAGWGAKGVLDLDRIAALAKAEKDRR